MTKPEHLEALSELWERGWELSFDELREGVLEVTGTREPNESLVALVVSQPAEQVKHADVEHLAERGEEVDADVTRLMTGIAITDQARRLLRKQEIEYMTLPQDSVASAPSVAEESDADTATERGFQITPPQISGWVMVLIGGWIAIPTIQNLSPFSDQITFYLFVSPGVPLVVATFMDSVRMRRAYGWPRFRGLHYLLASLVPIVNIIAVPMYLLNRREVTRFGYPLFCLERLRGAWKDPWTTAKQGYVAAGVLVTIFFVWVFVVVPFIPVIREEGPGFVLLSFLLYAGPLATIYFRRYSAPSRKRNINHGLRDVSIRLLTIPGLTVLVTILLVVLFVPLIILTAILSVVTGPETSGIIVGSLILSLYMIPAAVLLVLPLRLLPWLKALALKLRGLGKEVYRTGAMSVPRAFRGLRRESSGLKILPMAGHAHTGVELSATTDISMQGFHGYLPQPVSEIRTDQLQSSRRLGVVLAIPGCLVATFAFSMVQLFPDTASKYASMLPSESILLTSFSFIGVPKMLTAEVLLRLGLPSEVLSLGLVGGLIPAILLIPAAWHLSLEYEALLYRSLQRLGDDDHLLALWVAHIIPLVPLVVGYWTLKGKLQTRTNKPMSRLRIFR